MPSSPAVADAYTREDRISTLPDDLLVLILLGLNSTAEAVRTSVLAHRWHRVWELLPELRFDNAPEFHQIRELIDVRDPDPDAPAPDLRFLSVKTKDADPESAAAWLLAATRRVTGCLVFHNCYDRGPLPGDQGKPAVAEAARERGIIQLPCFMKAREIELDLEFLDIVLPSDGTFSQLTDLRLFRVIFHGPCKLGDVVSSPRCPDLQRLSVQVSHVIDDGLTIHSESLLAVQLVHLFGFGRQLTMVTPALQELSVGFSLDNDYDDGGGGAGAGAGDSNGNDPSVHIIAPELVFLGWDDMYHPRYVHFGNVEQVKKLSSCLYVYLQLGDEEVNRNCMRLLQRFQVLESLTLTLYFEKDLRGDLKYMMGDITMLPQVMSLKLDIFNESHAFGACCFDLLRMCPGLQRLAFQFYEDPNFEVQYFCSSDCLCEQPTEWKTEKVTLEHLEELVIVDTTGTDNEIAIFKQLFDWAVKLKKLRLKYQSNTESRVNEVHQKLQKFARPETCITLEEWLK